MWIRVNDAAFSDDMSAEQVEGLEKLFDGGFGEGAGKFVSITEGDWSKVIEVDLEPQTLDYVMENHPGEYIVCDRDSAEAATLRNAGYEETKGYFSDQAVFRCE